MIWREWKTIVVLLALCSLMLHAVMRLVPKVVCPVQNACAEHHR